MFATAIRRTTYSAGRAAAQRSFAPSSTSRTITHLGGWAVSIGAFLGWPLAWATIEEKAL